MATRKVRVKKLNVKQPLSILKEEEIDRTEYEHLTQELQVATGVEAGEENEYHLQVLLKTAGQKADNEIPVPPPQETTGSVSFDELYPRKYSETASYVRFSQTVEECIEQGAPSYDMTEDDDEFLKDYNARRPAAQRLSEDDFEKIMDVFEDSAAHQTPFAAVDKTILPYDNMVYGINGLPDSAKLLTYAKEIYGHWKNRRLALGNGPLHATLKFETHQDSDDMDPYVCFRRREVRQTRKTRARDVQSADKLKRLRRELEDGRQLILLSHERELQKRDLLRLDKHIFEKRAQVKEMKVRLGIKGDDNDLINQKEPPKKKPSEVPAAQRPTGPGAIRLQQPRPLGSTEMDLLHLEQKLARQNEDLRNDILTKIQNHHNWNRNHVDLTKGPLPPAPSPSIQPGFRAAQAQYLLTPPASSASAESMEEPTPMDLDDGVPSALFHFKGAPVEEDHPPQMVAYRRRIGRLNRLWIDRRPMKAVVSAKDKAESDRWKYDQDDSEDEQPVYEVDPYDTRCIRFRASIPLSNQDPRRHPRPLAQAQLEAQAAANAAIQAAANGLPHPLGPPKPPPPVQKQES
ncbi:Enhancer of polycomb-like protein 1 [Cytospora mali]|uniref:Enhancer of polycomb-like protein n=1 Tax=Cytospora mali TaxID=578113 RepID=A0A194V1V7_CYTMA|nr:Enhancer of polycomb-like protein 1 [Valsa mali var. pyri (nom. inval.)]